MANTKNVSYNPIRYINPYWPIQKMFLITQSAKQKKHSDNYMLYSVTVNIKHSVKTFNKLHTLLTILLQNILKHILKYILSPNTKLQCFVFFWTRINFVKMYSTLSKIYLVKYLVTQNSKLQKYLVTQNSKLQIHNTQLF